MIIIRVNRWFTFHRIRGAYIVCISNTYSIRVSRTQTQSKCRCGQRCLYSKLSLAFSIQIVRLLSIPLPLSFVVVVDANGGFFITEITSDSQKKKNVRLALAAPTILSKCGAKAVSIR